MKNIGVFLSENFQFLEVKFSIYLNRRIFAMLMLYAEKCAGFSGPFFPAYGKKIIFESYPWYVLTGIHCQGRQLSQILFCSLLKREPLKRKNLFPLRIDSFSERTGKQTKVRKIDSLLKHGRKFVYIKSPAGNVCVTNKMSQWNWDRNYKPKAFV